MGVGHTPILVPPPTLVPIPTSTPLPQRLGRIAFASNRGGPYDAIYVMDANGKSLKRLTYNAAVDTRPTLSPDGTKIAFESHRDGNGDIYLMDATGSNQTRLTDDSAQDSSPAWSPDGSQIAFVRKVADQEPDVYVMNADGSGQVNLTQNSNSADSHPTWVSKGKIAFTSSRGVLVMERGRISNTRRRPLGFHPSWSPDGRIVAFVSLKNSFGDRPGIHQINADGTNRTRLANTTRADANLAWSPDGTHLVFSSTGVGNKMGCHNGSDIYVMNADGSLRVNLTSMSPGIDFLRGDLPVAPSLCDLAA